MPKPEPVLAELELPSGVKVSGRTNLCTDFQGMRSLYESGMKLKDIADAYKVAHPLVAQAAKREGWISPTKIQRLRRDIEAKQREIYRKSGKATDLAAVKVQIWEDRAEHLKEKTYDIVRAALEGVTPQQAKTLIRNPLGLSHITTVVRQITGEEAKQAEQGQRTAVNIQLLRSVRVTDAPVTIDVEATTQD